MGAGIRGAWTWVSFVRDAPPLDKDQVVATGFLGMDVSFDGGKNWTHVSDSAHYVARFVPSGRTLWLAGNGHVECQPWPPIVNPHERRRTH